MAGVRVLGKEAIGVEAFGIGKLIGITVQVVDEDVDLGVDGEDNVACSRSGG